MRHAAIVLVAMTVCVGHYACGGAEVHTETTAPPASSSAPTPPPPASTTPPPTQPVAVRNIQMTGTRIKLPHELDFASDKATFDDSKDPNKEIVTTLLEFMQKNPQVLKMRIEGHTDNSGKPQHNLELSQQRADAVSKWLVDHGIDAGRLKTVGYGDTKPEVTNDTPEHKAQNRRTEFHIEQFQGRGGAVRTVPSSSSSAPPPPSK